MLDLATEGRADALLHAFTFLSALTDTTLKGSLRRFLRASTCSGFAGKPVKSVATHQTALDSSHLPENPAEEVITHNDWDWSLTKQGGFVCARALAETSRYREHRL